MIDLTNSFQLRASALSVSWRAILKSDVFFLLYLAMVHVEVPGSIRLDSALCRLLHDSDHSVRMFSIPVLPRLFQIPTMAIAWPRVPLPSAMRKKRQHDLPLYAAWDTCLAAVSRDQHFVTFEMVEEALTSTCDQLVSLQIKPLTAGLCSITMSRPCLVDLSRDVFYIQFSMFGVPPFVSSVDCIEWTVASLCVFHLWQIYDIS